MAATRSVAHSPNAPQGTQSRVQAQPIHSSEAPQRDARPAHPAPARLEDAKAEKPALRETDSGRAFTRKLDRASVWSFALLWLLAVLPRVPDLARSVPLTEGVLIFTIGPLLGYVLADFIAGAAHWFADRFFERDTPWIGPLLIAPFREHHVDPRSISRHDFYEVSGNNALATLPVVALLFFVPTDAGLSARFFFVTIAGLSLALVATNQFHGWAHAVEPPPIARWLQRKRLVLTPRAHARHHRSHDRAYCVTSGWLNPALDRLRFFDGLERLIRFGRAEKQRTDSR